MTTFFASLKGLYADTPLENYFGQSLREHLKKFTIERVGCQLLSLHFSKPTWYMASAFLEGLQQFKKCQPGEKKRMLDKHLSITPITIACHNNKITSTECHLAQFLKAFRKTLCFGR